MKLIVLKWPNCGAYVDVKEDSRKAVCEYCDTPFYVDGSGKVEGKEYTPVEESAYTPVEEKPVSTHAEETFSPQPVNNKRRWITTLVIYIVALIITIEADLPGLFVAVLIGGIIGLIISRPEGSSSKRAATYNVYSRKSQIIALILCLLFGMLGVHYFYVGKIGMGLLYLFTGGLFGIGWIVDIIRIIAGIFRDKDGFYLRG